MDGKTLIPTHIRMRVWGEGGSFADSIINPCGRALSVKERNVRSYLKLRQAAGLEEAVLVRFQFVICILTVITWLVIQKSMV